ncbi:unnamed protein product [Phytophthora fragariaefolia]|uniref:Unnamed protein product n=1 Tax=Phytophthora fragariaefolia TaxID=1490495 RepID=A0A9W6XJQ3_9STRA|nr:unnamed protein product [Phytophthora fragariaefolia]
MEDGEEEDEGTSSSTCVDPSVRSRRPREDDSDASSSKRSRSGIDRPLADAGPTFHVSPNSWMILYTDDLEILNSSGASSRYARDHDS